jgi:hypothetical protein
VLKRNKTTHLVIEFATGNKYEKALKWGTTLVSKEWLEACAQVRMVHILQHGWILCVTRENQEACGGARDIRVERQRCYTRREVLSAPLCADGAERRASERRAASREDDIHIMPTRTLLTPNAESTFFRRGSDGPRSPAIPLSVHTSVCVLARSRALKQGTWGGHA